MGALEFDVCATAGNSRAAANTTSDDRRRVVPDLIRLDSTIDQLRALPVDAPLTGVTQFTGPDLHLDHRLTKVGGPRGCSRMDVQTVRRYRPREDDGTALLRRAVLPVVLGEHGGDRARAGVAERAADRARARPPDTPVRARRPGTAVPGAARGGPGEARRTDEARATGLWLRWQLAGFDELERPLAAVALIERLRPAAPEERAEMLAVLREVGAVELLVRSARSRIPWRRALAVRTLGWAGAEETVPVLIGRIGDRSRYVREAAVRALGRVGDPQVLPLLGELFRAPRPCPARRRLRRAPLVRLCRRADVRGRAPFRARVGAGCLLLRRRGGLRARTGARGAAAAARRPGGVGAGRRRGSARAGRRRPAAGRSRTGLPRRGRDGAGGRNPRARCLRRPAGGRAGAERAARPRPGHRGRAGESLVRLARRPATKAAAERALARSAQAWPVERALVMDSVGAV